MQALSGSPQASPLDQPHQHDRRLLEDKAVTESAQIAPYRHQRSLHSTIAEKAEGRHLPSCCKLHLTLLAHRSASRIIMPASPEKPKCILHGPERPGICRAGRQGICPFPACAAERNRDGKGYSSPEQQPTRTRVRKGRSPGKARPGTTEGSNAHAHARTRTHTHARAHTHARTRARARDPPS